jgi:phage gp29-like protein
MEKKKEIIGTIETRQTYHNTQNIRRWKEAILAFENPYNPSRVLLYDMYDDIMLDGQVEATWGKRRDNILNRRLKFIRDGVEDERLTKMLNAPDMRDVLSALLDTVAYGYSLLQFNRVWWDEQQECFRIHFDLIPRKHVHPEEPFRCVSREQSGCNRDFLYMKPPLSDYMVWAGDPKDMGLFIKIASCVIYKRGGFGDWAQFSEMFGMPWREAIYESYDEDTRRKITDFLERWGTRSYLVHQRDVEIKMHDTGGSSSSSDVYDRFIQVCDAGISKAILGNTLTTEQGNTGARSLGEVHKHEETSKNESDDRFILSVLNTRFRSVMKKLGINMDGGEIWFESPQTDWENLQKKWNIINEISDKIPVSDDFIYEEFDIPKPDNYNEMKEEMRVEKQAGLASMFGGTGEQADRKTGKRVNNAWYNRLSGFFA